MWAPPKASSNSLIFGFHPVGQLELGERAASPARRRDRPVQLDACRARGVRCGHGGREHGHPLLDRRLEQPWVAAANTTRIERPTQADHQDLRVTQRAGDLIRSGEQTAEAARQGAERCRVRSPDEPDRSFEGGAQGDGDPPLRQPEPTRVDDDERRTDGGQSLDTAGDGRPAEIGDPIGDAHQRVVATPVVDVPRRQQTTRRRPRQRLHGSDRRRQTAMGELDDVAHQATCLDAGWRMTDGHA